ncbi:unnamed protein product [Amoebophrya sp. A120]|nr:unnamed protein product [Amoebophrya sp. A120]|eukprot:GSA120T00021044001.1
MFLPPSEPLTRSLMLSHLRRPRFPHTRAAAVRGPTPTTSCARIFNTDENFITRDRFCKIVCAPTSTSCSPYPAVNYTSPTCRTLRHWSSSISSTSSTSSSSSSSSSADVSKPLFEPSISAANTVNPIRRLIERTQVKPLDPSLEVIPLSIGDPTHFGNFRPPDGLTEKITELAQSQKYNGYQHSTGMESVRQAIADRFSSKTAPITADDVILTSGCSHALDLAIQVLCNPGDVLLVPQPAFPLYETLAKSRGVEIAHYRLDPERNWEVDLTHLDQVLSSCQEKLRIAAAERKTEQNGVTNKVGAVLLNSPSNPCGNVFGKRHLKELTALIYEKHDVPIIADEIYANMAFDPAQNAMLHEVAEQRVPFLSVGGIAKQYMVPGWRMGWLTVHDDVKAHHRFEKIHSGLQDLSTLILGPSTLQQMAIPFLLQETSDEYYEKHVLEQLKENAETVQKILGSGSCDSRRQDADKSSPTSIASTKKKKYHLRVIEPQGAMYVLVQILDPEHSANSTQGHRVVDDVEFCRALLQEQSVFALPYAAAQMNPPRPQHDHSLCQSAKRNNLCGTQQVLRFRFAFICMVC